MAAFLFMGVPAGVLVDRRRRKPVLIGANLVRAVAVLTVPLAFAWGSLSLCQLFLVAAIVSTADVFFTAAHSAVMPTLLAGQQLGRGYAHIQAVQSGLAVTVPGLVGVLIRVLALPVVLVISGVAYLFSAAVTCWLPEPQKAPSAGPAGFWAEAGHGASFALKHPLVRTLMVSVALLNAAGMWGAGAKVVYILKTLHLSVDQVLALGTVSAAGGLLASLLATGVTSRLGIGRTKIIAGLAGAACMVLVPAAPSMGLEAVFWVGLSGFGWSFFVVLTGLAGAGILPRLIPPGLTGRVMSTNRLVTLGVMPVASLTGGYLALLAGEAPVLWTAALIAASSALPVILSPLRSWTVFPEEIDVGGAGRAEPAPSVL
ncbi:MFS family permease [Arthrobacter sp. B3I4]|nr:MFS family permease [Arthrobacter sp. B3I4]